MLKIRRNYDNQTLNIIYGNNHFELVDFFILKYDLKKLCKKNNEHHEVINDLKKNCA
jgi:hypothetical protein